jgi:hypothetical protein
VLKSKPTLEVDDTTCIQVKTSQSQEEAKFFPNVNDYQHAELQPKTSKKISMTEQRLADNPTHQTQRGKIISGSQSAAGSNAGQTSSSQTAKRKHVQGDAAEASNSRKRQKRPEFHAFKELYAQFCKEHGAKQPKEEAKFAWRFIKAIEDDRIRDWVLEALKARCADVMTRAKKGADTPFSLTKMFTWERLRDALNEFEVPSEVRYAN